MRYKTERTIMQILLAIWLLGMPIVYGWKVNAWKAQSESNFERQESAFRAAVFSLLWPVLLPFSIADSAFAPKQPVQPERSAQ
jgi:hypothetical protein